MDYPAFSNAINKSGFNLSEPETKQIFNEFRLAGPSGVCVGYIPPFFILCRRIVGHMMCTVCSSEFSGQAYAPDSPLIAGRVGVDPTANPTPFIVNSPWHELSSSNLGTLLVKQQFRASYT